MRRKALKHDPSQTVGKVLLAMGIIWGSLSLVFVLLGVHSIRVERTFESEGITAPGVVTAKRVTERRGRDKDTNRETISRTYYLQYKFSTREGREMTAEASVSKERWEGAHEEDAVLVEYLPSDAASNRMAGESGKTRAYIYTGLGSAGVLIGLAAIIAFFRRTALHRSPPAGA